MTGEILLQIVMAMIGALGFGLLFHIYGSRLITIMLGAAVNWGVYLLAMQWYDNRVTAFFVSTLATAALGRGARAAAQSACHHAARAYAGAADSGRRPVLHDACARAGRHGRLCSIRYAVHRGGGRDGVRRHPCGVPGADSRQAVAAVPRKKIKKAFCKRLYSFADKQERTVGRSEVVRKFPIQKLSPSRSQKSEAHVLGFLEFAWQILLKHATAR